MGMTSNLFAPFVVAGSVLLSACGGSGGGGNPSAGAAQGVLMDAAVAGIEYRSGELSGITNDKGIFQFQPGAEITFYIGDIVIGTAAASAIVTPVDLVAGALDEDDPAVTNILRFLQTLDDDANPDNGIQINAMVRRAAIGAAIDFTLPELQFEENLQVQNMISDLTLATTAGQRMLVGASQAREHFRLTLTQMHLSGNLPSGIGERLSEEEMIARGADVGEGLWQMASNVDATISMSGSQLRSKGGVVLLQTTVNGSPGITYQDDCDLYGALEVNEADDTDDTDLGASLFCPNGRSETAYYLLAANHYRVELICDEKPLAGLSMRKLSDEPVFNNGAFSFNSGNNPSLDSHSGVCGAVSHFNNTYSDSVSRETSEETTVRVVAPYQGGDRIELEMTFATDTLTPGTYVVGNEQGVGIRLSSPVFSTTSFSQELDVKSGSVTIESVSAVAVKGRYTLTINELFNNQDLVTGSFAINLE